ncbi:MAG: MarR family transcriptional regulator [Gemmatimonadetes bacterium]|nr:MarR family transcriptional regulator [Gemmatimonadota bacterium]MCB9505954.1 MarR family transcriptional regulator [Gemmatimonadales bacterium]MCA9762563.1 MarR family transcriptional regulator [Gemmatimonadota bacterium]MCA9769247.1 MarR family transcriptional regulator [Gemmatimonadota bacterium]HPF61130.1 MarR family transcriptional regulator [Gemmatimonadales bacterium]
MPTTTPTAAMGLTQLEERVLVALVRATARATERSNAVTREAGLSPSQYNVLRILAAAGPAGLSCNEIADRMVTREPDLTRLLAGLAGKRAVSSSRSPLDGRVRLNRLTAKGTALLERLDTRVTEAAIASLGHLGRTKLTRLHDLLEAVANA